LTLMLVCCACNGSFRSADCGVGVVLIGDFLSCESPSEISKKLGGKPWKVISDSRLGPGDPRPEFSEYTVLIENYEDLGVAGELQLQFLNERLMEADFFPVDSGPYVRLLGESLGTELREGVEIMPSANKVVWTRQRPDKLGVGFADKRLRDEASEWIRKYA